MNFPDPFLENDPRWHPYTGPQENPAEFSQPDATPQSIKNFLRSKEGEQEIHRLLPPQPASAPEHRGAALGYIPTF
jgi:hypothetical protein